MLNLRRSELLVVAIAHEHRIVAEWAAEWRLPRRNVILLSPGTDPGLHLRGALPTHVHFVTAGPFPDHWRSVLEQELTTSTAGARHEVHEAYPTPGVLEWCEKAFAPGVSLGWQLPVLAMLLSCVPRPPKVKTWIPAVEKVAARLPMSAQLAAELGYTTETDQ